MECVWGVCVEGRVWGEGVWSVWEGGVCGVRVCGVWGRG